MATVKQRLCRKNASGEYDTVHLETSSEVVRRPNGQSVELGLAGVSTQLSELDAAKANKCKIITVTLAVGSWNDNVQTVTNNDFLASGYAYDVSPVPGSHEAYAAACIYANDVNINTRMVFHCTEVPTSDLTVRIKRTEVEA